MANQCPNYKICAQSRGQVIDLHNPLTRTKITGDGSFVITAR